jgi:hypothetical protein
MQGNSAQKQRMKLTGATILLSRGIKVLQAAPRQLVLIVQR